MGQLVEGSATYREITTQTAAWEEALLVVAEKAQELVELWVHQRFDLVLFAGCGSTYYLSLAAAALFQELTSVHARGVPAGELVMYPRVAYAAGKQTLLVAISRSAETTETLRAVEAFRQERQGEVIVITNYGDRPLAGLGRVTIAIPSGQEQSIAQTRSFASMYVASTAISARIAGRKDLWEAMHRLPECGSKIVREYEPLAASLGGDPGVDRFYFLGSGPRYGLACEANLKMKEMSLTHSEPFHFLEFRHGPKSMVGSTSLVVGLLSDENQAYEAAVLRDVEGLGAKTLGLGEFGEAHGRIDVPFGSGMPEAARNVLYLPILQLMAYYRAMAKGLDPDQPHNLDAVVRLE